MAFLDETGATILADEVKTYVSNTAVAKETGKGLSTNDYTTTEKNKLAGIAEGANKTIVDSALDVSSENPVQNKVVKEQIDALTTQINNAIALRSSLEQYGMTKLSNSAAVTDSTGLALPATEKNATIEGTLANQISQLNTNLSQNYQRKTEGDTYEKFSDIPHWLCNVTCSVVIDENSTDDSCPYPNDVLMWWNVLQFGNPLRLTQIASQSFLNPNRPGNNELWIRNKHDDNWSDWKKIG